MAASPFYTQIHTTKRFRLLTRKGDVSSNSYVYLKGVASLAAGDWVTFDKDGVTTRSTTSATGPLAIAMSANTSSSTFSWFLIRGYYASANVATHSSGAQKALFITGTSGRLTTTPLTENCVFGAFTTANAASNVGGVYLASEPISPGDIST